MGREAKALIAAIREHVRRTSGLDLSDDAIVTAALRGVMRDEMNPWSEDGHNMTTQGQIVRNHGLESAQVLADAAGKPLNVHLNAVK